MSDCLWTFATATTTGFESDLDTISGVAIASLGDGTGADAVPVPTVPGQSGNGRLLCSANHYNAFATAKVAALIHTSGNPLSIETLWRPLIDYDGVLAGACMLQFGYLGFVSGGAVGNTYIVVEIRSEATTGLYTFRFHLLGFYGVATDVDFTGISLTFRDWNEITIEYDGANAITLTVNNQLEGTIDPTDLVMPTTTSGRVVFDKVGTSAIYGVIDTVSISVS